MNLSERVRWLKRLAAGRPLVVGRGGWWGFPESGWDGFPSGDVFPGSDVFPGGS